MFIKVGPKEDIDKLIDSLENSKQVLKNKVEDKIIGDQFQYQENAQQQKTTTDSINSNVDQITTEISAQLGPISGVNMCLDNIIHNLFAQNNNASIVKLLQDLKPIAELLQQSIEGIILAV